MRNPYFRLPLGLTGSCLVALSLASGPALAQVPEDVEITVRELPEPPAEPQAVPGEIIVKMRAGMALQTVLPPATLAPLGLRSAARMTSGGEMIYQLTPQAMFALQSAEDAMARVEELAAQLSARPEVEYAQPNWILHPSLTPNDSLFPLQWHYRNNGSGSDESPGGINLVDAWDTERGQAAVAVAVLDTGILPAEADIAGSPNLAPGYDMISDPFIANDGDGRDSDPTDPGDGVAAGECGPNAPPVDEDASWHGSHVAGTIGVVNTNNGVGVAGANWFVTTVPVRVLGKCGGTNADINDGIRWAAGLPVPGVPANPNPARVINMSLGAPVPCTQAPSLQAAINDAVAAGTVVVVAAGNDAIDVAGDLPGGCDNVVAVAASDARGHLVTRYSNFGQRIDILAPGGDLARNDNGDQHPDGVLSTVQGGYALFNGTSMAAPHTAGVAALMLAVDPALTPAEIEAQIKANAIPRNSTQCPRPCGAGLLNAEFVMPAAGPEGFEYSAKLVCGGQDDPKNMALVKGFYGTTINVRNPGREPVRFEKSLALTLPPGGQEPGELQPIAEEELPPQLALAVDCNDLEQRLNGFPQRFIEGFVVIRSAARLDVVAVYTTATLARDGTASQHSSIEVERVRGRPLQPRDNDG
jgi:serine protease